MDTEDCPQICAEGEETNGKFCDECPVKIANDNFKEFSIENLENNQSCKGKWQKYGFELLRRTVEEISSLEELPRNLRTVKTHQLIQAFQNARRRFERIQRENEKTSE